MFFLMKETPFKYFSVSVLVMLKLMINFALVIIYGLIALFVIY